MSIRMNTCIASWLLASMASGMRVKFGQQERELLNESIDGIEDQWRVFSDLDDTMCCSHNDGVAGIDTNCDHHKEIYPGVLQFYLELSRGPAEGLVASPCKVVPISARPEELRFLHLSEKDKFYQKNIVPFLKGAGVENWGLDLDGAQYGSLANALSVFQGRYEDGLSKRKFDGWLAYSSEEPTFFIGDNGQGDVLAAEMMMDRQEGLVISHIGSENLNEATLSALAQECGLTVSDTWAKTAKFASNDTVISWLDDYQPRCKRDLVQRVAQPALTAGFIHHVQHLPFGSMMLETAPGSSRSGWRNALGKRGILFFMQYGHAACIAYQENFISAEGYERIMTSIMEDCAQTSFERVACQLVKPEFDVSESGDFIVRPASHCMIPWEFRKKEDRGYKLVPHILGGFTSTSFFAQYGHWAVERKCMDIGTGTLRSLKGAFQFIKKAEETFSASNASAPLTWKETCWGCPSSDEDDVKRLISPAVAEGMPYMVDWILAKEGVTCMSKCGTSCGNTVMPNAVGVAAGFKLRAVGHGGTKVWDSCKRYKRNVCRISLA